jgi:uncharacterized protein YlxW (UPF0749 family)
MPLSASETVRGGLPRTQLAAILLVVAALGFLLAVQVRSQARAQSYLDTQDNVTLGLLITGLSQANNRLLLARFDLAQQEDRLSADISGNNPSAPALQQDLARLQVVNGVVPVHGPGVEMTIGINLQPFELSDTANALRELGAEAISINGYRVIARTVFELKNGKMLVDGHVLSAPYKILAIGEPSSLSTGVQSILGTYMSRGPAGQVQLPDVHISAVVPDRPVIYSTYPQ